MKDLVIIAANGDTYSLYGTSGSIHPVFLDGVGMPVINRALEKSPLQHGASDRGFRLDVRQMILQIHLENEAEPETDATRDFITNVFAPTNEPLKLRVTRDDDAVRQIDCFVTGLVDYPQSIRKGAGQPITIPLVAPDPIFYDPTEQESTGSITSGTLDITINLDGYTWDEWPIIEVTGPITDLTIIHSVQPGGPTVEEITLDGEIPSGETWTFDLRPGVKTLRRNSDSANRMSFVDPDTVSAFATMRILSTKTATTYDPGTVSNRFRFQGTSTDANSAASITWYKRYLSL